jgi:predicted transcriptional regulator
MWTISIGNYSFLQLWESRIRFRRTNLCTQSVGGWLLVDKDGKFVGLVFAGSENIAMVCKVKYVVRGKELMNYISNFQLTEEFVATMKITMSISTINSFTIYYGLYELDQNTKVCKDINSHGNSTFNDMSKNNKLLEVLSNLLKGNECKVIELLSKFNELNQTELAVRANIPKSTLSRMLADLEKRGLIIRYKNGMSKIVKLSNIYY